jgi:hypothetical protein
LVRVIESGRGGGVVDGWGTRGIVVIDKGGWGAMAVGAVREVEGGGGKSDV